MSWYIEEKLKMKDRNKATIQEMRKFLTLWDCVCGTCIVCSACIAVVEKLRDEEE